MNLRMMQRLMWKDMRLLMPLVVLALAGIVLGNVLLYVAAESSYENFRERMTIAYVIWLLIPNLFAFGAPALLVGGEEESGSLAWLKTTPVGWKRIALSKLLTTLSWLIVVWIFALACYLLQWQISPESFKNWANNHVAVTANVASSIVDPIWLYLLGHVVFGLALLLTSFICAYFFRSPITALLCVGPAMVILSFIFALYVDQFLVDGYDYLDWAELPAVLWVVNTMATLILTAILLACYFWSARRRLEASERTRKVSAKVSESIAAYRPTSDHPGSWYGVSLAYSRPRPIVALYWQAFRQNYWPLLALTIAGAVGGFTAAQFSRPPEREMRGMIAVHLVASMTTFASLTGIASLTFYGDSVRSRKTFFADRGIAASAVWRTRIVPTFAATIIVLAAMLLGMLVDGGHRSREFSGLIGIVLIGYAFAQLISQWAPRPTLAFFAAPALFFLACVFLIPLMNYYDVSSKLVLYGGIPILLFFSWRMTHRWINGPFNRWHSVRYAGFLIGLCLLPYLLVLGFQWLTMPRIDHQWRQSMIQEQAALETLSQTAAATDVDVQFSPDAYRTVHEYQSQYFNETFTRDEIEQRVQQELDDPRSVGAHVSFDELFHYTTFAERGLPEGGYEQKGMPEIGFGPIAEVDDVSDAELAEMAKQARERDLIVAEILLRWSNSVRRAVVTGRLEPRTVEKCADAADRFTVLMLEAHLNAYGKSDRLVDLINRFPSRELARRSRRVAIINRWNKWHQSGRMFFNGQHSHAPSAWWLGVERERMKRQVDVIARTSLNVLEGKSVSTPEALSSYQQLDESVYLNHYVRPEFNSFIWMQGFDKQIEQLQRRIQ